eukprot:GHVO01033629.1.p1 GENE.GHVO01033629.1~~GHVO01033629.1.p1  ORF type:complete len:535 (+),score=99.53 GHVO01033629.1:156-1607(+)
MYHALMFPRNLGEMVDGVEKHWSPYAPDGTNEGEYFDGPCTTDSGFWDSYHTIYTFLQLLFPDQLGVVLQGYVNAFNEGGWVPQWGSPGYRTSMVGTMSDVSFADAIVKGFDGFDVQGALEGMRQNAFSAPEASGLGRRGLPDFRSMGYIPRGSVDDVGEVHEIVAQTLNHAFADWAIYQAAKLHEDLEVFSETQMTHLEEAGDNWKNIFNSDIQFFQAKDADGNWVGPFDEYLWGGDLTEGGPWQFRFYVPHDVHGLAELYGGTENLCAKLEEMNTHESYVHRGPDNYGSVIHEMIEVPLNVWGQNSHNNQPSHHVQYMFIAANDVDYDETFSKCVGRGQHWIRHSLLHAYNTTHFTGDEDNGEMGAWYVLNAMGLYTMTPGSPFYDVGIPLFEEIQVELLGARKIIKGSDCNYEESCTVVDLQLAMEDGVTIVSDYKVTKELLADATELQFRFREAATPGGAAGLSSIAGMVLVLLGVYYL